MQFAHVVRSFTGHSYLLHFTTSLRSLFSDKYGGCSSVGYLPAGRQGTPIFEMYYTYILKSKTDSKLYTGWTINLHRRLVAHNSGKVRSTKSRIPFELIYSEEFSNKEDAIKREKELKSGQWREIISDSIK